MATSIFLNIAVSDLPATRAFWEQLGFSFNAQFSDDEGAAMVIDSNIFVMLLTHDKFRQFTPKPVADSKASSEVLICISRDSREAVETLFEKAIAAGGSEVRPADDYGFMTSRSFADLDGHIWEVMWMDPNHVQG